MNFPQTINMKKMEIKEERQEENRRVNGRLNGERGYFPQTANIYLLKTALLHRSEEERLEL